MFILQSLISKRNNYPHCWIVIIIALLNFANAHLTYATETKRSETKQNLGLSIGIGLGIPYALLGGNLQYRPFQKFSIMGSYGYLFEKTNGVGVTFYLNKLDKDIEPRLSLFKGTNAFTNYRNFSEGETFKGVSIGVGASLSQNSQSFEFDVLYLITSDVFEEIERQESAGRKIDTTGSTQLTVSLGYRFSF